MGMIRVVRCTNAERIAYGGIEAGRIFFCTDTLEIWIGTAGGDLELGATPPELGFLDNFDDAARYWAWQDLAPVGTITEPAGTYCQISIPPATAGNWGGPGMEASPRPYLGSRSSPQEVITKLVYMTDNAETQAGMFISNNPLLGGNSGYTLAFTSVSHLVGSYELGVGAIDASPGAVSLPLWLRIRTVAEGNGSTTYFHYSTDGTTWLALGSVADEPHRAVGLFAKNWTNNAIDSRFDFFSIMPDPGPR